MPDMGTVEGQVTLVRWLKAEGDNVALGEPLFEVETDKGVSEVEAALAGVLLRRMVADGARVGAGETIAMIRRPGEPDEAPAGAAPAASPSSSPARPRIAPTIRALAEKRGVNLETVRGTGPGGLITREDVLKAAGAATSAAPSGAPAQARTRNQDIVARKVSQSHREKPVFHVTARVDMTTAIACHQKQAASYDAIFVKAAGVALAEFPAFVGGREAIDVAIAIDIDDDLFAPAVRSPASRSAADISREIEALVSKAKARALGPADVEGTCFLVSNLGMFPVESFDAVIYPEHSAALAVGSMIHTPVSDGMSTVIAPIASLTLSVDHRFINGRAAARFVARVKQIVETGAFE